MNMYKPQRNDSRGGWKGGDKKFGDKKPWDRNSGGRDFARPELFPAVCAECGSPCEVPFRPAQGRDVFCRNCFKKDEQSDSRGSGNMDFRRPSFEEKRMFKSTCAKCGNPCEVPFRPTGEKPVYCRDCFGKACPTENKASRMHDVPVTDPFKSIHAKLDAILKALNPTVAVKEVKEIKEIKEEVKAVEAEKPKKVKKEKAAKKKK